MKILLIVCAFISMVSCEWRQGEYKLEVTLEHQMIPEKDTIIAKHYHKVNNGFYVITTDSLELWVDNLKEIK